MTICTVGAVSAAHVLAATAAALSFALDSKFTNNWMKNVPESGFLYEIRPCISPYGPSCGYSNWFPTILCLLSLTVERK